MARAEVDMNWIRYATLAALLASVGGCDRQSNDDICREYGLRWDAERGRCVCAAGFIHVEGECVALDGGASDGGGGDDGGPPGGCRSGEREACGASDVGECSPGERVCVGESWGACEGAVGPTSETCNGRDDDCNGMADDGSAASSCGAAPRAAELGCSGGACYIARCASGWGDCDRSPADGCETELGTLAACLSCGDVCGWECGAGGCLDPIEVAAGGQHSCALRSDGAVFCWGSNTDGQVGDGTTTSRARPTRVAGLAAASHVAVGGSHSCAIVAGEVWCWGQNTRGQLGDGTMVRRVMPVRVAPIAEATQLSLGALHSCVRTSFGGALCWGANGTGQLGDGSTTDRPAPTAVVGLSRGVDELSASLAHTCAVRDTRGVVCWGSNGFGQLGDGTLMNRSAPTPVSGLTDVAHVAAGHFQTCALTAAGSALCWGDNTDGQLGDGTTMRRLTPVAVSGVTSGRAIGAGYSHVCVLDAAGIVTCAGLNANGQVGDGTSVSRSRQTHAPLPSSAERLTVGAYHSCARLASGAPHCWGLNVSGQLGDGTALDRSSAVATVGPL